MNVTEFTLDASGVVPAPTMQFAKRWSDLSPFAQGYVEALLRESAKGWTDAGKLVVGFSEIHPEALAMILRDCEAAQAGDSQSLVRRNPQERGRRFWKARQEGVLPSFPPLRVYLDDAGKVRLEAAQ